MLLSFSTDATNWEQKKDFFLLIGLLIIKPNSPKKLYLYCSFCEAISWIYRFIFTNCTSVTSKEKIAHSALLSNLFDFISSFTNPPMKGFLTDFLPKL